MSKKIAARRASLNSVQHWSTLKEVVEALALVEGDLRLLYVERLGRKYRWSFAHSGGPYALFRTVEGYLGVEPGRLYGGYRTLSDGTTIQCEFPEGFDEPDAWIVLSSKADLSTAAIKAALQV